VDIAVEGDAVAFAEGLGGEVTAHGRFGTAVVTFEDGRHWDVVTTRRESYAAPAALPDVEAGTIDDDLARRDFTVNAMAASRARTSAAGRPSRRTRRSRRARRPSAPFAVVRRRSDQDLPRRSLREPAQLSDGSRDGATGSRGRAGIALLSPARFREEVVALLSRKRSKGARAARRAGRRATARTGADRAARRLRSELDPGAPPWRLALVGARSRTPGLGERLSLRRQDARAVEDAVALAPRLAEATDPVEVADLAGRAPEAALLALAHRGSPALREWFTRLRDVHLEVDGGDLAELGLPESPRVGEVLEELQPDRSVPGHHERVPHRVDAREGVDLRRLTCPRSAGTRPARMRSRSPLAAAE
jgi:hypothetical protein